MTKWVERSLSDLARYQNGYPFKPSELTGRGLPVIRIKQLLDATAEVDYSDADVPEQYRIKNGDLIFSWSATLAVRVWTRGEALLNQHLFRVVEGNGVDRQWLGYALDHSIDDMLSNAHGTTMKHITKSMLQAHRILLPPLSEQRRVAAVMSAVDVQIKALEVEWRDALQMRSNLLLSLLAAERPSHRLGEVMSLDIRTVNVIDTSHYPIVGVLNRGRGLLYRNVLSGSATSYKTLNLIRPNQIIYSRLKAFEGAITVVPKTLALAYASAEFPTFTCGRELLPSYFALLTTTQELWDTLRNLSTGMGGRRERVKPSAFLTIKIKLPSVADQTEIVQFVSSADQTVSELAAELAALRVVRTTLLTALLSHEITVDEAVDKFVKAT